MAEMNFSFNGEQSAVRSNRRQLTANTIHKVKWMGAEIKEVGKDTKYKILALNFENEEGYANMSIFWPTDKDAERQVATASDGHEYERPSRWENTKAILAQTMEVLNPTGYEKFKEASKKFRSFDDMAVAFVKVTDQVKGAETNVKFSGYTNKQGYPQLSLPTIVGVNKQGECFVSDNYIGDVVLSAYEMKKAKEASEAKPTTMKSDPLMDSPATSEDVLSVDDLDLGL